MFRKILIANRGEIACRVMRTARNMNVATVAVYSDADAHAQHVAMADDRVRLGPPEVAASYLRGDLIIEAALATGAEAIHPGYGFLSENPDFVEAVEAAGLVFIGPSSSAIRAMGLKDAAKVKMQEAGVPVVPGYLGEDQDAETLREKAAEIGYPVLIKAVAGGGGKGMRLVETDAEFASALKSAQSEAKTAFGNANVLIEKFITNPRHIEVQVFGDGESAVHLFERDCSLQRRHQKVIEEAPAPGMTDEVRAAMGQAAVRAAKAIGYSGAGTVEFIVDGSGDLRTDGFWFMEMNTRLQVEHPVTEEITGVDLVEWQLRVAAGEGLPKRQEELSINGHSFEARLYAEDVPAGFLPATGILSRFSVPLGVRLESGVREGDEISPWYDPMIAKLVIHAPTRADALEKLAFACETTQIAGTVTNLSFLAALARHEAFARGEVDTGLIARDIEALTATDGPTGREIATALFAASGLAENDGQSPLFGFTLWGAMPRTVTLTSGDREIIGEVSAGNPVVVTHSGETYSFERGDYKWHCDGQRLAYWHLDAGRLTLFAKTAHVFDIPDPLTLGTDGAAAGDHVLSPMPGLVRDIHVTAGQAVSAGDPIAVLEAMKMEHILKAPRDGVIQTVVAEAGGQVEAGALIVALEEVNK